MAGGTAAQSRDVYAAVEWSDFYGGFKEAFLDDRIPRHMAVQTKASVLGSQLCQICSWTAEAKVNPKYLL